MLLKTSFVMDVDLLQKILDHLRPKPGYPVFCHGNKPMIRTGFDPPLVFPKDCRYEMALTNLETYYSFPNIDDSNNIVKISSDGESTWKTIQIDMGCYSVKAINTLVQKTVAADKKKNPPIVFEENSNTLKCILEITDDKYAVDFRGANSLRSLLGFEARIYGHGRWSSTHLVNIMSVNTILVHCSIVGASRVNGREAPVVYSFFPNVGPGEKIVSQPKNLIYLPLTLNVISQMTCWLTDQNGSPLNLRGEEVSITFHIKSC